MLSRSSLLHLVSPLLLISATAHGSADDYSDFSLEELMDISISSMSKREQKLSEVPAAITVVTADDIKRRGVDNLPDALRLVPGVHVARTYSDSWVVSIRGFSNEYVNKLLVLVDGQSIYSEYFSGVLWDLEEVVLEDIAQIEVIRGPGASIWGVNAVNGVINIITKEAQDQIGLAKLSVSNRNRRLVVTDSHKVSDKTSVRFSFLARSEDELEGANATNQLFDAAEADDPWKQYQLNLRMDRRDGDIKQSLYIFNSHNDGQWDSSNFDVTTFSFPNGDSELKSQRILGQMTFGADSDSEITVQLGYKNNDFETPDGVTALGSTYEMEFRHNVNWTEHKFIYGASLKEWDSAAFPGDIIDFSPRKRDVVFKSVFFQDEFTANHDIRVTWGARWEHNSYTHEEFQPTIRFLKPLGDYGSVWGALSRAVRTPSRTEFDTDITTAIQTQFGPYIRRIMGNKEVESELAVVKELGYRNVWTEHLSTDFTIFYHDFDDLVTQLDTPTMTGEDQTFVNGAQGRLQGIEWAIEWQSEQLRLGLNGSYMDMKYSLKQGFDGALSPILPSDTDITDWLVGTFARWDYSDTWAFDIWMQYVSKFASNGETVVDGFTRVDARAAWKATPELTGALVLQNLTNSDDDVEFVTKSFRRPYQSGIVETIVKLDVEYKF